jgi:hypothetical protein
MAASALYTPVPYSVNDSSYSRTLKQLDEEARGRNQTTEGTENRSRDGSASSSQTSSESSSAESEQCAEAPCAAIIQQDVARRQKQQACLRGGASALKAGDSHSIRTKVSSSTKKRSPQPGLLEALFLPRTTAAKAAVVRRHSTLPDVKSSVTASAVAPSIRSQATVSTTRKEKPKSTNRLSLFGPPPSSPPVTRVECITCLADDVPIRKTAKLECNHRMCLACLSRIFTLSTTDPQLMPPRCCTDNAIPLRHVDRIFDDDFKRLWNRKYAEYTTKDRLYCPTKGCGLWIKPKYIHYDRATRRKMGVCSKCKTKVCKKCGVRWHGSRECHNDDGTKRVIDMGKEQGWQRCHSCRAMVQLAEGCNHMKCRCNAEFCMVCGSKWKTCDCPWFNLPPDLMRGNEFMMPGGFPPAPNGMPGFLPPPPPPGPPPFVDGRDIPFDPLNPPPMFIPPGLPPPPRPRPRRAMTMPAPNETPGRDAQEAADEVLARQLQEQELDEDLHMMNHLRVENDADIYEDPTSQARRRAARRARARVYVVTDDDDTLENVEEDPAAITNDEAVEEDDETPEAGNEATIAGLRHLGEGRVESWRRNVS